MEDIDDVQREAADPDVRDARQDRVFCDEELELVNAFRVIPDASVRREIMGIVKTIAAAYGRST